MVHDRGQLGRRCSADRQPRLSSYTSRCIYVHVYVARYLGYNRYSIFNLDTRIRHSPTALTSTGPCALWAMDSYFRCTLLYTSSLTIEQRTNPLFTPKLAQWGISFYRTDEWTRVQPVQFIQLYTKSPSYSYFISGFLFFIFVFDIWVIGRANRELLRLKGVVIRKFIKIHLWFIVN